MLLIIGSVPSLTCDDENQMSQYDDWKGTGWYRMVEPAGTKMTEAPVSSHHCGTMFPGWLNGTHPKIIGETESSTVCFNTNFNSCAFSLEIEIKNCGDFYLYHLVDTSTISNNCQFRYCSELEEL